MTQKEINHLIISAIITFAVGVNGYFIKRLVDKVDRIDEIEKGIALLQADVRLIKVQLGFADFELSKQGEGS